MTEHNFPIDSAAVSDRGLSQKRPQNEDSFLELNDKGLFAVADGVGGAQAGDVASQMAMEIIEEAFINLDSTNDAEEVMKLAIEKANSSIYQMSRDLTQLSTMATTVVALHLSGNIATIGHVGDSRLYRLDGRGRLYPETMDHSVVAEEVRAGRMTVAQAANHPSKNIISRALGAEFTVKVDLKTIMFEPKTTFLLCSDGITRHIEDFEIRDLLISMESAEEICQRMKDICYERGAEDNLTAVIARVTTQSKKKVEAPAKETFLTKAEEISKPETEEVTVANPRPPLVDLGVISGTSDLDDEIPTQQLEMPAYIESEVENFKDVEETDQQVVDDLAIAEDDIEDTLETIEEFPAEIELEESIIENEIEEDIDELEQPVYTQLPDDSEFVQEKSGTSLIGNIISSIGIFLIGLILGAGLYYIFSQSSIQPSPMPQNQPVLANEVKNQFEESRRSVDKSPSEYLRENASIAESGEDYYLLGRAYFLDGNFPDAKLAFEEAEKRLNDIDEDNRAVVENDIETFLVVITEPFAQKRMKELFEKKTDGDGQIDQEPNSNGN